jgi:hypothetical protein
MMKRFSSEVKKNAVHEYKYFENASLYLTGLKVFLFEMSQVLEQ